VVSRAEAAALARDNPISFLHVCRSEIDLPDGVDAYDPRVYARARENLDALLAQGALVREARPALFLYREVMEGRAQVGVVGCVHLDDYETHDDRRVRPGAGFTIEPGLYFDTFGVRTEINMFQGEHDAMVTGPRQMEIMALGN